jgi:hypothetical protein
MHPSVKDMVFKFHLMRNGTQVTTFRSKGYLTDEGLRLRKTLIPFQQIKAVEVQDKYFVILLDSIAMLDKRLSASLGPRRDLVLTVAKKSARKLKQILDRTLSVQQAKLRHESLGEAGKADLFRATQCPQCGAAVDLTDYAVSPHVFCPYCESFFTETGEVLTSGDEYQICSKCGLFEYVQGYTEFYFYFLVVVWGYSVKDLFICRHCVRGVFRQMLLGNLLFILGLIPTIQMWLKMSKARDPRLPQLTNACALVKRGRYEEAAPIFEGLHAAMPGHPGILLNQAIGHINGDDYEGAAAIVEESLVLCANYEPTRLLRGRTGAPA